MLAAFPRRRLPHGPDDDSRDSARAREGRGGHPGRGLPALPRARQAAARASARCCSSPPPSSTRWRSRRSSARRWRSPASADPAAALAGSLSVYLLELLGTLVTAFFLYGIIMPLTNGALTIAAADRILGGQAEWREVWMLLFRRLGKLLSAVIPAAIVVAIGCVFFLIPGLVLALFFTFVSPVVLIEGLGGRAALERSTTLVRSDWLRVALLLVASPSSRGVAQLVASTSSPHAADLRRRRCCAISSPW